MKIGNGSETRTATTCYARIAIKECPSSCSSALGAYCKYAADAARTERQGRTPMVYERTHGSSVWQPIFFLCNMRIFDKMRIMKTYLILRHLAGDSIDQPDPCAEVQVSQRGILAHSED